MNTGEKLKQARLAANLTQEVVAEILGVSRQTISNWENGRSYPDIANVISLSDLYDLTLDSLLKGDKEIMKHLKETTDVTTSNKQLAISLSLAGLFCAALILTRIFIPTTKLVTGIIPNIVAIAVFAIGAMIMLISTLNIKKLAKQKTSNKTLIKAAFIALYVIVYAPLVLVIPEVITSSILMKAEWMPAAIRVITAIVLLIPAFVIYKRLNKLFSEE